MHKDQQCANGGQVRSAPTENAKQIKQPQHPRGAKSQSNAGAGPPEKNR